MVGPEKRLPHMHMDPLASRVVHRLPEIRCVTNLQMDWIPPFVRLPDPKLKTLCERGIECIFVRYAKHSKAFRFYVIEPNESALINSIIESRDAIFNENKFSSVLSPSLRIPNGTEDIGGSVVPEEVVQQPEPELRKRKRNRTPKSFGPEFQLYLIKGTRDEVSDQHSYCFNVEDDPKIFDEVLADLPLGCKPHGCKWIFKRKLKVDGTIEKFKARLVIQSFRQKSRIDYFNTYAPVVQISAIRLLIALASIHSLIIHHMDAKPAFLNGELEEDVYMNQPQGFIMYGNENKVLHEGHGEADVILCIRIKHESIGIAISQSYYIEKKDALMQAGLEILKIFRLPVAGYSCLVELLVRSAATLGKNYSQMYNGKSRYLGVRHNMIRELIMNGVVSIEFVRSQQNLVDHLKKGFSRDLFLKSAEGMSLKSYQVAEYQETQLHTKETWYSNGLKGSILRTS
ncbi:zinc finger, CCHC-type containing protein [Tanacetum coccineum]